MCAIAMGEAASLLATLQHGDSFFPSGAISFSWGLETLHADGAVTNAATLARFVEGQLVHRWATSDRPALLLVHRAGADLDAAEAVDAELEALALPAELRSGSRRAGGALLGVHERLGTARAAAYRERVLTSRAPGHLAAAQGLVLRTVGSSEDEASAVSAHGLATALLGAALRLGIIGHLDVQRTLSALRPTIVGLLAAPMPESLSAFGPEADIAMMRHEIQSPRLFAN